MRWDGKGQCLALRLGRTKPLATRKVTHVGRSEMHGIEASDHMVFACFSKLGKANWLGKITTELLPFCDKDTSCGRSTNPS